MTTFSRVLRTFAPPSAILAVLTGCAQQQAAESAPEQEPVKVAIAPQPASNPAAEPKAHPPAPPAPSPPAFAFPADLAGQAIAKVVTPDVSRPLPAERFGAAPKPRTVPAKVIDPEAVTRAKYVPPPLLPAPPVSRKPAPPPEKVPLNLGAGADGIPAKPVLPVVAVVIERARDVNLPPLAPTLGRPLNERVSLEDPTSEFGNATVVAGQVKVPLAASGFLKAVIPDPFELGEQVKPKVPAAAEPTTAPVPVNPQRVK